MTKFPRLYAHLKEDAPCLTRPFRRSLVCRDCPYEVFAPPADGVQEVHRKPMPKCRKPQNWRKRPQVNDRFQPWADMVAGAVIVALAYVAFCWILPAALGKP